ncbi:MAG: hypothetical protein M1833_002657 [Piccolia ochrophora]|nr:MAG: hypothetical protein M1833_002657 [Piccolia ochrophora]
MWTLRQLPLFLASLYLTVSINAYRTKAYVITGPDGGVNAQTGERPARQEIRTFQNSGPAWDLYIQALQTFQQLGQGEQLSYYQVSGIHGRPFIAWDGVNGPYQTGYCTHASVIFPPWHRPYLSLYEQLLWNSAQTIAAKYPAAQKARYQAAAVTFRIPYWDWALDATMPAIINTVKITVNTPTGSKSIDNPLYSYKFHPVPSNRDFPRSDGPIATYRETVRYPDANGKSQPAAANQQLAANAANIHDRTYLLLTRQTKYAPFSNTGFTDDRGQSFDSLEAVHNDVHGLVGNGGHMSYVPYSAFDPIFWLHHTNCDRLFAIWQAIYPNSYVTSQSTPFGTFTIAPGSMENVNTPLTPFRRDNAGNLYTSASARNTKTFKYTYPEVKDWGVSASQLTANTKAAVKALYDPTNQFTPRGLSELEERAVPKYTVGSNLKKGQDYREWFINFEVDKNELDQPNFIHFFLGSFTDDAKQWSFDKNLVGTHASFTIQNTTDAREAIVLGSFPLTRKLVAAAASKAIDSLDPEVVKPYLEKNLAWRVQTFDDRAVPTEELSSLKVYVVDQEVTNDNGRDQFPRYGKTTPHTDVTRGKKGGTNGGAPPGP